MITSYAFTKLLILLFLGAYQTYLFCTLYLIIPVSTTFAGQILEFCISATFTNDSFFPPVLGNFSIVIFCSLEFYLCDFFFLKFGFFKCTAIWKILLLQPGSWVCYQSISN